MRTNQFEKLNLETVSNNIYNIYDTKTLTTYSKIATRWENAAITENNFASTPESKLQSHSSRT